MNIATIKDGNLSAKMRDDKPIQLPRTEKQTFKWKGDRYFLLGIDTDGIKHYLQAPEWSCGWYWGKGYVRTFTNNREPWLSSDITMHTHFDSLFFNGDKNCHDLFIEMFPKTPLSDKEIWTLWELMKTIYLLADTAEIYHTGSSHITNNPCKDILKRDREYSYINDALLPSLFKEVETMLTPEKKDEDNA